MGKEVKRLKRMKAVVAYDGTDFAGYQFQPGMRTVQSVIDKALVKLHKDSKIYSVASGRTDSGVHALGQVIHFDTPLDLKDRWTMAFNTLLPKDVRVMSVEPAADDFHARYDAAGKTYRYIWSYSEIQSPFERNFAVHLGRWQPDIERMRAGAVHILGTHDFTSFCSSKTATENRIRTVRKLTIEKQQDRLVLEIEGDGFLYNMVRTIAGVLFAVGIGWDEPDDVKAILAAKDRKKAGKTAPAHGLYLVEVTY